MTKIHIRERPLGKPGQSADVEYDVTIDGAALPCPVGTYQVVPHETGSAVTLLILADNVSIGGAADGEAPETRTWAPVAQDPRADIPGWTPEVARG